eukprot:Platyproteum_vivax@DN4225_c0_g1_i1.p1
MWNLKLFKKPKMNPLKLMKSKKDKKAKTADNSLSEESRPKASSIPTASKSKLSLQKCEDSYNVIPVQHGEVDSAGSVDSSDEGCYSEPTTRGVRLCLLCEEISRLRTVECSGSWDDWSKRHPMQYDSISKMFFVDMFLPPGEYVYKFIVDGEWMCEGSAKKKVDSLNNENNYICVHPLHDYSKRGKDGFRTVSSILL